MKTRLPARTLRASFAVAALAALSGCGWFWGGSARTAAEGTSYGAPVPAPAAGASGSWTCSNLSPVAQQYMRSDRAEDLNCGPGGSPVPAS